MSIPDTSVASATVSRRRSRADTSSSGKLSGLTRTGISTIPSFKKEIVQDPIRYFNLVAGENKSGGFDLHEKMTKQDLVKIMDDRLETDKLDGTDSSVGAGAGFVFDKDISAVTTKDISYYTSVILHSLYCSRKKGEDGFRLLDGEF
jgi:hypothetical protein